MDYKMSVLVRKDLPMSAGKVASQVGHAVTLMMEDYAKDKTSDHAKNVIDWMYGPSNQKKIILAVDNEHMLNYVKMKAKNENVRFYEVIDEGNTELKGKNFTCLGLGPDEKDKIEILTTGLNLYR